MEEAGRGFRDGNTCYLPVDSCDTLAKPIQYCKKNISLQLKNVLFKKSKKESSPECRFAENHCQELPEPLGVYPHCQPPLPISVPLLQWNQHKGVEEEREIWLNSTTRCKIEAAQQCSV